MTRADARGPSRAWNVRRRPVQVAPPASGREPIPAPPTQCRAEASAASAATTWLRPAPAGLDDPALAEPARCHTGGSGGDRSGLAPRRLQGILALEVAKEGRTAEDRSRPA